MQRIRQDMTGYRMPGYVEEILTQNYCGMFMNMSIVSTISPAVTHAWKQKG